MKCIIGQPAGLGDIFFCQKIGFHYQDLGYEVIWPVKDVYSYLPKYLKNFYYPVNGSEEVQKFKSISSTIYLKLDGCTSNPDEIMRAKYSMLGLDYSDWTKYFEFERDIERENRLVDFFNIQPNEKFNLLNRNFATPPNVEKVETIVANDYRTIEMNFLGFDNLFDWCTLLERAEEIHTVNTAICYMIEKLQTTNKLFMYQRGRYMEDWNYVNGIYTKDWKYNG